MKNALHTPATAAPIKIGSMLRELVIRKATTIPGRTE
jgi:hypothetical protein